MNNQDALQAFVADLIEHAEQLRAGRKRMGYRKLAEFRSYRYGEDDAFFPLDLGGRPWRKHRIAVTLAELKTAGYEEYHRFWRWSPNADPWRHIYWGGEVPLWRWDAPGAEHETRLARARFLRNLASVLESRTEGAASAPSATLTTEQADQSPYFTRDSRGQTGKVTR